MLNEKQRVALSSVVAAVFLTGVKTWSQFLPVVSVSYRKRPIQLWIWGRQ